MINQMPTWPTTLIHLLVYQLDFDRLEYEGKYGISWMAHI
jgi:hypothetical protein